MRTQRFGIEIELTGLTREKAAEEVARFFNTEAKHKRLSLDEYHIMDRQSRTWKVVSDSSLTSQKKEEGIIKSADATYQVELVSPILTYADIEDLQEIVRLLRAAGAFVNKGCGIHIHIDAANHSPRSLKNLINLMASKEELTYKALEVDAQRIRYCKKVNEHLLQTLNKQKPATLKQLENIWYQNYGSESRTRKYHSSRYQGLNFHSVFEKGTVEFRLFNSTTHAGKIKAYIQFCLAISHQAIIQKSASAKRTQTDNEKYTFRCWLLRLGLNGEEFKTCRLHLLANLTGNAAWRNAA